MKRSTLLTLSVVTLVALQAAPALAGKKSRKNNQDQQQNQSQNQQPFQQRKFNVQSLLNGQPDWQGVFKKHKHHDDDDAPVVPLDPGRGDGRVPVEPVTPPSRPGFVWVNDHWERERAPLKVVKDPVLDQGPFNQGPVIRDHRTDKPPFVSNGQGQGGVTVTSGNGPIIRDHRDSSSANGGVTVTSGAGAINRGNRVPVTIFNPTGSTVWSAGPVIRDHRTTTSPAVSNGQGQGGVTVTSGGPIIRDHRDSTNTSGANGGVTVTTSSGGRPRGNSGLDPFDVIQNAAGQVGNVLGIK